jgi:hypothetical protein
MTVGAYALAGQRAVSALVAVPNASGGGIRGSRPARVIGDRLALVPDAPQDVGPYTP